MVHGRVYCGKYWLFFGSLSGLPVSKGYFKISAFYFFISDPCRRIMPQRLANEWENHWSWWHLSQRTTPCRSYCYPPVYYYYPWALYRETIKDKFYVFVVNYYTYLTGMNSTGQLSSVWIQTPTTRDSLKFFKWWPGWDRGLHSRNFRRALMQVPGGVKPGITLSRKFDGRLTDYYFWNIKPSNISLPFICEKKQRRQEELGCFYGQVWSLTQFLAYSLVQNTVFSNHRLCWMLRLEVAK